MDMDSPDTPRIDFDQIVFKTFDLFLGLTEIQTIPRAIRDWEFFRPAKAALHLTPGDHVICPLSNDSAAQFLHMCEHPREYSQDKLKEFARNIGYHHGIVVSQDFVVDFSRDGIRRCDIDEFVKGRNWLFRLNYAIETLDPMESVNWALAFLRAKPSPIKYHFVFSNCEALATFVKTKKWVISGSLCTLTWCSPQISQPSKRILSPFLTSPHSTHR